jgi:hypothetical protein
MEKPFIDLQQRKTSSALGEASSRLSEAIRIAAGRGGLHIGDKYRSMPNVLSEMLRTAVRMMPLFN